MTTPVYAYTDESGNTGLDIFNADQPVFHTLTIFAKRDLNAAAATPVAEWCNKLGVSELHAKDLRVPKLSVIAADVAAFLKAETPMYLFTSVVKRHQAAMKFADTVLDAGINKAVSPMWYNARPLRMRLALGLAEHLTPRMERAFWKAFRENDPAGFKDVVDRVESAVAMRVDDPRGRELLGDALRWASKNPGELLVKQGKLDAPNLVAFSFIVQGFHDLFAGTDLRVKAFIHDEQNEFMKSFRWTYDIMHKLRFGDSAFLPSWEEADTFECPLTEETGSSAPALQVVDILLWLLKRYMKNGTTGSSECDDLITPVLALGSIHEFSRDQLIDCINSDTLAAMSTTPSRKKIKAGVELRDKLEAARKARMASED